MQLSLPHSFCLVAPDSTQFPLLMLQMAVVQEITNDELPVSSAPVAPAEKNPATDALEAAKALEAEAAASATADHK